MTQQQTPIIAPQVTGTLDYKLVAAYLKQAHKDHQIMVQRLENGEYLICSGFLSVKVMQHPDLFPFVHFNPAWKNAIFAAKELIPTESIGPDQQTYWETHISDTAMERLTVTNWLKELISGTRNKTGQLVRKLATYELTEEKREVLIDKKLCDMLTPDGDVLKGFLFEQAGDGKPVRVAARYGYVAILMPMQINR